MNYIDELKNNGFIILNENKNLSQTKKYNFLCSNGHEIYSRLDHIVKRLDRKSRGRSMV